MTLLVLYLQLALAAPAGAAEEPTVAARLGTRLRVELLTMGPGTETYSRFGHSALRIKDLQGKGDVVFNFGTFDHEDPQVIRKFLAGTLRYWLSVSTYADTRAEYRKESRRLIAQQLRLTPLQRRRLFTRLYRMSKPDQRNYRYHHFRANCSTKIRDVLDEATGGLLGRQLRVKPAHTRRHWLRRATRGAPLFHLGFDLVITRADTRITSWDACFAPEQLMRAMAATRVSAQGQKRSFVSTTRVLLPGPDFHPDGGPAPWTWAVGLAWLLLVLGVVPVWLRPRRRWAWRIAGGALVLWGLLATLVSLLLIYVWTLSSLPVFTGNQNLALLPPTLSFWIAVGVQLLRRPAAWRSPVWLAVMAGAHLAVAVLYSVARLAGWASQGNTPLSLMVLPWALAGVWFLIRLRTATDPSTRSV